MAMAIQGDTQRARNARRKRLRTSEPETSATALLRPREAAHELGVAEKTLETWRLLGSGPVFIRLSARCVRYAPADLRAFCDSRKARSTSDSGAAR